MRFNVLIPILLLVGTQGLNGSPSPLIRPGGRPGPAISSQTSQVVGGNDITGIANGLATAQGGN